MKKSSFLILMLTCIMYSCSNSEDITDMTEPIDKKEYAVNFNVSTLSMALEPMESYGNVLRSKQTRDVGDLNGFHMIEAIFFSEDDSYHKQFTSFYLNDNGKDSDPNLDFGKLNILLRPGKYKGIVTAAKSKDLLTREYPIITPTDEYHNTFNQIEVNLGNRLWSDIQMKIVEFEVKNSVENPTINLSLERIVYQVQYINTDTSFPDKTSLQILLYGGNSFRMHNSSDVFNKAFERTIKTPGESTGNSAFIPSPENFVIEIYEKVEGEDKRTLLKTLNNIKVPIGKRLVIKGSVFDDINTEGEKDITIEPDNTEWIEEEIIVEF